MAFGSVHNHSDGSNTRGFMDSTIKVEDLIEYARELNHIGVVLTDHDTITNHKRALNYFTKAKKDNPEKWKDFKFGLGNEIYLCSRKEIEEDKKYKFYHFILIAKDLIGHEQIRTLSTRAWVDDSFTWVNIRTPTYYDSLFEVVESNRGHLIGSTACFIKDTPVLTKTGWKPIQKITSEDYIKNMYGEWEQVNFPTTRSYQGKGYKIKFIGIPEFVTCTKDHKFLTTNNLNIKNIDKSIFWKTPSEFIHNRDSNKDYVLYPCSVTYTNKNILYKKDWYQQLFPVSSKGVRKTILPDEIIITPELMRMFGLFLGDGSIHVNGIYSSISFSFNIEEYEYYKIFIEKALKQLQINFWREYKIEKNHKVEIIVTSVEFIEMMWYLFGKVNAETKKIPNILKHISPELDMEICFGYLLADGYFGKVKFNTNNYKVNKFCYGSISNQLAKDFQEILYSLEINNCMNIRKEYIDKNGTHHKKQYIVTGNNNGIGTINKLKNYSHKEVIEIFNKSIQTYRKGFIRINNILYKKVHIKKIEEIQLNEQVYCLNVDSHSFVCNGVIVHNCLGGQCPEYILEAYRENPDNPSYKRARTWLKRIEQCFGKGNFFLELQPSLQEDQKIVNKAYIQLSEELDIPYIFTTDSHYLKQEDRPIHEAFLKSNDDGGKEREVGEFYATTYLMSEDEIHSYTDDYLGYDVVQKGLDNTKLIFDQIEEYSLDQELVIPYLPLEETEPDIKLINKYKDKIPLLEEYATSDHQCNRHLTKVVLEKIEANQEELANRETYEAIGDNLNTIKLISEKTGQQWSGYLLQVRDLVATCWEAGSLCAPGRGSGVGFILLYLLDITQINPLREETKTYPWRFLNPERVSVPDIDSDFINFYRDKVISLLQHKYCGDDEKLGKRRVMKVQTLSTVKAKSAIQTAARGLGVTPEEAQFLSSFIIAPRGMQYNLTQTFYGDENENLPPNTEFVNLMTGKYKELWNVAKSIEGLINGVGSHAGGVVITSEPIEKYCALMKTSSGDIITQHDLHQIEDEGQQ